MNKFQAKKAGLERRKRRVRGKVTGTADRPRLAVHRTNAHIYAFVGELDGKRAVEKGVTTVRFDRGGRLYHGRVQALADGARNAGLKF